MICVCVRACVLILYTKRYKLNIAFRKTNRIMVFNYNSFVRKIMLIFPILYFAPKQLQIKIQNKIRVYMHARTSAFHFVLIIFTTYN